MSNTKKSNNSFTNEKNEANIRIEKWIEFGKDYPKSFLKEFWSRMRKISATETKSVFEFDVTEEECNLLGNLHGGCIASIVDTLSVATLMGNKNGWTGVSTDLTVSYVSTAFPGDIIRVECSLSSVGKKFANMTVVIRNNGTGKVVAIGQNTLFNDLLIL
ncbi:87_t:CDS:2 [Ambispora gerdemannii]|uniref:87_t:CDS:1 n=1 Tax=Ambispora gerdemannii TaxID=144530 RepID=A0A9N8VJS9_9GLOM|nr:87_t:CDS:2 [Ambispora gerdemannii]